MKFWQIHYRREIFKRFDCERNKLMLFRNAPLDWVTISFFIICFYSGSFTF